MNMAIKTRRQARFTRTWFTSTAPVTWPVQRYSWIWDPLDIQPSAGYQVDAVGRPAILRICTERWWRTVVVQCTQLYKSSHTPNRFLANQCFISTGKYFFSCLCFRIFWYFCSCHMRNAFVRSSPTGLPFAGPTNRVRVKRFWCTLNTARSRDDTQRHWTARPALTIRLIFSKRDQNSAMVTKSFSKISSFLLIFSEIFSNSR